MDTLQDGMVCQHCGEEVDDYVVHRRGIYHGRCVPDGGLHDSEKVAILLGVLVVAQIVGALALALLPA